MFKDKDGVSYRHPERSCKQCKLYPCLEGIERLRADFAKYGCKLFDDVNTFEVWTPKR